MSKSVKTLYIIGFIFSILILVLSILFMLSDQVEGLDIIKKIYERLDFNTSASYTTIICMANAILMIITIILKPLKKVYAIIILILSILTLNIFGFIGSIILLTDISRINRVRVEKERQIRGLNDPQANIIKKPTLRLEPTKTDLVFLYTGIILASIFIFTYCFLFLYFFREIMNFFLPDINGPELLGLLIFILLYMIVLFILFLIPIVLLAINIVLTAITITKKRVALARILSVYGFLSLTIFNAIASINMIKRFKKRREEEKAQSCD